MTAYVEEFASAARDQGGVITQIPEGPCLRATTVTPGGSFVEMGTDLLPNTRLVVISTDADALFMLRINGLDGPQEVLWAKSYRAIGIPHGNINRDAVMAFKTLP